MFERVGVVMAVVCCLQVALLWFSFVNAYIGLFVCLTCLPTSILLIAVLGLEFVKLFSCSQPVLVFRILDSARIIQEL